jgi:hypothetical protein
MVSVSSLLKLFRIALFLVWYHIGTLIFLNPVLRLCIGTSFFISAPGIFLNPVPSFVSVPSHIIISPVPHSNLPDPSGGSAIYESGTGKIILLLPFLEGTDPIMFCSDPMIDFFIVDRFSLVIDLADTLT